MLQKNIYNEKPDEYVEQIEKQNAKSDANMSEAQKKGLTTLANQIGIIGSFYDIQCCKKKNNSRRGDVLDDKKNM